MQKTRIACAVMSSRDQLIAVLEAILKNRVVELELATTPSGERVVELRGAALLRAIRLPMTILKRVGEKWQARVDALAADQCRELTALLEHERAARAAGAPERVQPRKPVTAGADARAEQPYSVLSADGRRLVRRRPQESVARVQQPRRVVRRAVAQIVNDEIADPAEAIPEVVSTSTSPPPPAIAPAVSEPEAPIQAAPVQAEAEPEPVTARLARLDERTDMDAYAAEIEKLERSLATLALGGDARALDELARGLKQRAGCAGPRERTRAGLAARALLRLRDPEVLAPVATAMLTQREAFEAARSVLVLCGASGAQALVRARRGRELNDAERASFIAVLRDLGAQAFAALAAGLDDARLEGHEACSEDLLRALPDVAHEVLACAAARYADHASPVLRRAAVHALGALQGPPAIPTLRAALCDTDISVRRGACAALRRVGGLDAETAVELTKIACGDVDSPLEVRVMAAAALAQCAGDALGVGVAALRRIVDPPARSLRDLLPGARPSEPTELLIATACRTLLAIGGDEGRRAVALRSAASAGELKKKLRAMLDA